MIRAGRQSFYRGFHGPARASSKEHIQTTFRVAVSGFWSCLLGEGAYSPIRSMRRNFTIFPSPNFLENQSSMSN